MASNGFHKLLARLDRDPARAYLEFERIRHALTRFFDWRGAWWPEDCADETLERVARKLEENVTVLDVTNFAHGIARMVLKEASRAQARRVPMDDSGVPADLPNGADDRESLARRLEDCLGRLSPDERGLVLAYYAAGEGRSKAEGRRRLAGRRGLTENALRSRVQRLRDRLEACLRETMPRSLWR